MGSYHRGSGQPSRGGLNARNSLMPSDQLQITVDQQFDFDKEVDGLRSHVGKIKQLAYAIEDERKQQDEVISGLQDALDKAGLMMKRAQRRLNITYKQARSNHLLFLVLFAFALFFSVYMLSKLYRLGKWIF